MEEVVAITVVGNSGILVVIERYVGLASLYNELISVNAATRMESYRTQIYNSMWIIVNNTNSSTFLFFKEISKAYLSFHHSSFDLHALHYQRIINHLILIKELQLDLDLKRYHIQISLHYAVHI